MKSLIHPVAIETMAICHQMTFAVYDYCKPEEYIAMGTALKAGIATLVASGEYGAAAEIMNQTIVMLEKHTHEQLNDRKKCYSDLHMEYEALEFHLKNFATWPGAIDAYVWGDPVLDDMIVKSVLRGNLPASGGAEINAWLRLGAKLAKTGSIAAWDQLYSAMASISIVEIPVRAHSVLSIALLPKVVQLDHAEILQGYIDQYVEIAGDTGQYYRNDRDLADPSVSSKDLYDALVSLDRREIAFRYMDRDLFNDHQDFKIQNLMLDYQWVPGKKWEGNTIKNWSWEDNKVKQSIILYHLAQEPGFAQISFGSPGKVAEALSFHGSEHRFGTLQFHDQQILKMVNDAFDMTRGKDRYEQLQKLGFEDRYLALCDRLLEDRLTVDLSL